MMYVGADAQLIICRGSSDAGQVCTHISVLAHPPPVFQLSVSSYPLIFMLRQAAYAQEIIGSEPLEHRGKGAPMSRDAGQVSPPLSLPPKINRGIPIVPWSSMPILDDVRGCRCAVDYLEGLE